MPPTVQRKQMRYKFSHIYLYKKKEAHFSPGSAKDLPTFTGIHSHYCSGSFFLSWILYYMHVLQKYSPRKRDPEGSRIKRESTCTIIGNHHLSAVISEIKEGSAHSALCRNRFVVLLCYYILHNI